MSFTHVQNIFLLGSPLTFPLQLHMDPLQPCDVLNENGPHRLVSLRTWSPVGGTIWEGLGVCWRRCHLGQALEFQKTLIITITISSSYLWFDM